MKNFELNNAELKSLDNNEMREIDGGLDINWKEVATVILMLICCA